MKSVRNGSVRTSLVLGLVIIMAGSAVAANIYDFTLPSIDGKPMPLAEFEGKVGSGGQRRQPLWLHAAI